MSRAVLYVDPPAFCTTVEGLVAPALRTRPVAVAPPGVDRALVLALSAEARGAGITRGMPVRQAKRLCPDLVLLPPNPRLYARASRALHEVLRRYAPLIEPRWYGHAFLDVTGTGRLFGPARDLAERIRREARARMGLPLSIGVATNKLVSEAAATVVKEEDARALLLEVVGGGEAPFLAPHPVEILPDVPPRIRTRLDEYRLERIGEVAALGEPQLCAVFGPPGRGLLARARGIDPRPVLPPALKREFRVAHTLATDTNDLERLHPLLRRLSEALGARLRRRGLVAQRLAVEIAYADYTGAARAVPLDAAPLDRELWDAARRAFELANRKRLAVRTLTLAVDRLLEQERQLELWDGNCGEERKETGERGDASADDRAASLQQAIDRIHRRWGAGGIGPGRGRTGERENRRTGGWSPELTSVP